MFKTGECWQQEHTQHTPTMKTEYDYLSGWIQKQSHMQKCHPEWWTPETKLGMQKKKNKKMDISNKI